MSKFRNSVGYCVFLLISLGQTAFFDLKLPFNPTAPTAHGSISRIAESAGLIEREYYDRSRINPTKMMSEGFYELAKEVPEVLPKFEGGSLIFQLGSKKITLPVGSPKRLSDILPVVAQSFQFIKDNYRGDKKFDDMEYAFIAGMLAVLDPHSNILPPKIYEEFKTQTEGEYGGLGIVIALKENELSVISPIEDTPAFRAGIAPDDKILEIGEQSTTNMSLNEAVDMMRGKVGTQVTLKVKSKNTDPRLVTLTRELIAIKSVQSKLMTVNDKLVGVIRFKGFQKDTYQDLIRALGDLKTQSQNQMVGMVLDFRNNPGGLLDQAIRIADRFLSTGDIVYTVGANNNQEEVAVAHKHDTDVTLPLIVLINEGSASASEIVAGALKNNDRAVVMGTTSFGKGSVQSLLDLSDGSSLKLTVAQYLTPGKISIQAVGISPDIHLYPSMITDEFFDLKEDLHFAEDKLDAHLKNQALIRTTKPYYDGTYLKEGKDKEESEYVSKIKEDEDYPLMLAANVLSQIRATTKSEMLKLMIPVLDKESEKEDQKIAKALSQRKIDWSRGQQTNRTDLTTRYQFIGKSGQGLSSLAADSEAILRVTLKNTGEDTLYRVIADVESINPLLNHKEFVFGKIEPSQETTQEVKLKIPPEIISFKEDVKLGIYSERNQVKPFVVMIATQFTEKTPPQFAYSYTIIDGGKTGTSGNQNGIPEPGEQVELGITLANQATVPATKAVINIKNKEGNFVFLKKARESLGLVKPGGEASAILAFDIKETFSKKEFAIDFFAIDDDTKATISDSLIFQLDGKQANPQPGELQSVPQIVISEDSIQSGNVFKLIGRVTDATQLKDIAVFVKGKKEYYVNLETQATKAKDLELNLLLEDGMNFIMVQARGNRNLLAQKTLSVVYHDATTMTAGTK